MAATAKIKEVIIGNTKHNHSYTRKKHFLCIHDAIGKECDEPTSVDKAMAIYVNPQVNPTQDLTNISESILIYDWHEESGEDFRSGNGINGIPFANCTDYCNDTDTSPCFGDITIPENENNRELFKVIKYHDGIFVRKHQ